MTPPTIPCELVQRPQWVIWKRVTQNDEVTKPPINAKNGRYADHGDSKTWCDYGMALRGQQEYRCDGVGYVFSESDPYTGIDIDDCRNPDTGEIADWAMDIIRSLDSYTEVSPSRMGVKIWIRGKLPPGARNRTHHEGRQVEIYSKNRYFTVTGEHVEGTPIEIQDRQPQLMALHARLFEIRNGKPRDPEATSAPKPESEFDLSDDELIMRASARNGARFSRLWPATASDAVSAIIRRTSPKHQDVPTTNGKRYLSTESPTPELVPVDTDHHDEAESRDAMDFSATAITTLTATEPRADGEAGNQQSPVGSADDSRVWSGTNYQTGAGTDDLAIEPAEKAARADQLNYNDAGNAQRLVLFQDRQPASGGENNDRSAADASGSSDDTAEPESKPSFRLTKKGVEFLSAPDSDDSVLICGRLEIIAQTRNHDSDDWGRLLRWTDNDSIVHTWAMPMSMLAGDGNILQERLLSGGLYIAPGSQQRGLLRTYIQTARTRTRARSVNRLGWAGDQFVLPDETIGAADGETLLFQAIQDTEHHLRTSGSLTAWRNQVGRKCSGNSRLILSVSCAFAGPLLSLVGAESGGIHLYGPSSLGKTTALLVGASVCGGGGKNGYVQSWRTTANGLEAIAQLHNDLTLFLDELGQVDPREAAEVAYLLGNGTGKARMTRTITARPKLTWSLLYVSAGEMTLADHAQTAGKRTKGGAEVRLLNIDADAGAGLGLFEELHGADSPDAFSRQLRDAAKSVYGTPLRAYLNLLANDQASVLAALQAFCKDFLKSHIPERAAGEVSRAAARFALIGFAGELATSFGITGWNEGEATEAARRALQSWIDRRGTAGTWDEEAAIRQIVAFVEANGASRFQSDSSQIVRDRVGFKKQDTNGEIEYQVLPEAFRRDLCAGFDHRMVAQALVKRGYLTPGSGGHPYTPLRRLPELGQKRVYVIKLPPAVEHEVTGE